MKLFLLFKTVNLQLGKKDSTKRYLWSKTTLITGSVDGAIETSPFTSIWLEISTNWYTKSQGPKKKGISFSRGRIYPCPAHTARNSGSFTPYTLWSVESFFPQLHIDGCNI